MENTSKILRKSIHTFLKNYHFFTTIPALIAFPFSISLFVSQSLPCFNSLENYLSSLFYAAGFPSSPFVFFFIEKISQTITTSILTLPSTIFFLLVSKLLTIQYLHRSKKTRSTSNFDTYTHMLATQLCNFYLIIATNCTCFALVSIPFTSLIEIGFSSPFLRLVLLSAGVVLFSIILANTLVITNLALISSGVEHSGGYLAILKACAFIRGRTVKALSLAITVNTGLAAVECLFRYRVVRAYYESKKFDCWITIEGIVIVYSYSIIIVVETIISYVFFKNCKKAYRLDQERRGDFQLEYEGLCLSLCSENVKIFEEI